MRDHLLFAVLPYVAGLVFLAGSAVPLARRTVAVTDVKATRHGAFDTAWRLALAAVAIGHLLTLAFPGAVLRWDREFVRLVLLEGARIAAGSLAAAGAALAWARVLRPAHGRTPRAIDVVAATLLVTATFSGLAVAIVYRWASAWSAVLLAPYVSSLARFDPSTDVVARLPVLVKLHIASAIAIVAVLPFTSPARAITSRLTLRRRRRIGAPQALDGPRSWGRHAKS
jgi:nitrate reductase gamma subunit